MTPYLPRQKHGLAPALSSKDLHFNTSAVVSLLRFLR